MPKNLNIIVILAIIAVLLLLGLGFLGMNGLSAENRVGSLAAAQSIMEEVQQNGTVPDLRTADITEGTGNAVAAGDIVVVNYTGILPDGTVFDSSAIQGRPLHFQVGVGYVIKGWDQGLLGMKEGGRRLLVIPPHLAYGESGQGTIPPNATLIFEVELLQRMTAEEFQAMQAGTPQE